MKFKYTPILFLCVAAIFACGSTPSNRYVPASQMNDSLPQGVEEYEDDDDAKDVAETKSVEETVEQSAVAESSAEVTEFKPGDEVPAEALKAGVDGFFSVKPIPDDVFVRMEGKTYKSNCTVPRSELRYIRCLHVDAKGRTLVGEMVLNQKIASKVLGIFRKLYDAGYPIEKMLLADNYGADDERIMTANCTSAFNFRFVSGTRTVSKHGLGMAVDINPLYNPCKRTLKTGEVKVEPAAGKPYVDRTKKFDYKLEPGDLCHRLFKEAGFRWGGDWRTVKDYQHFEMP